MGHWGNLATEQAFHYLPARPRERGARLLRPHPCRISARTALSDKQAKDIYAYIRTFKSSAPDVKDIPTLNAIVEAAKQDKK